MRRTWTSNCLLAAPHCPIGKTWKDTNKIPGSQTFQQQLTQDHPIPKITVKFLEEPGALFLQSAGFLAELSRETNQADPVSSSIPGLESWFEAWGDKKFHFMSDCNWAAMGQL